MKRAMIPYKSLGGDAGVVAYEIHTDSIIIKFIGGDLYLYNNVAPGKVKVEAMKKLAVKGRGLSTFISQKVKKHYAAKLN